MAKLTSPRVSVTFTELGISAITRGDKGTVALIVRDGAAQAPFSITQASQVPAVLGKETQDYIKRTFLGYVTPPKKVIVYVTGEEGALTEALDYMAAQTFDYICGPADCAREEVAEIASWVKSQRLNNGAKYKAVLPNHPADNYAVVNFTGDAMTDGTAVWTTAAYCSRVAGLLTGTPMKIAATYAPLPELSDCARLTREESDEAVGAGELALRWDGRKVKLDRAVTSLVTTSQGMLDSFKTLFGSEGVADDYLENMVDMANHTPFLYDDLVSMSKTLATYGYSPDERSKDYILDALQTIGDTGAALGLGTGDMTAVAQALGRMKSSDKTTLEYLNILNDRGIGAVGYLADYYGKSQGDIYGMISKGQISGTDAVEIIMAALSRDKEDGGFAGAMREQSETFAGITSTLEGLEQELQNAGGDAYNSLRQSGKSEMVAAYDGELGDAIKEINAVIGETQARRENLQDQYAREVLDAVLNGNRGELWSGLNEKQQSDLTKMHEEYVTALERYEASGRTDMEAGAELAKLYETAQTMGQSYFDNSAEIQRLNEIEIDEITLIRENTAGLLGAVENIYAKTQEMSKGLASLPAIVSLGGRTAPTPDEAADAENALAAWRADPDSVSPGAVSAAQNTLADNMAAARRNAFGLARVPYDEYPALLHEGERVLTAAEARAQDAGGGQPVSITITGNSFTGMPEEMADQLAQIILQRLTEASIAAAPK